MAIMALKLSFFMKLTPDLIFFTYFMFLPSNGHGPVRDVHRADPAAVAEGVHATTDGAAALRRVLGFLLLVYLHHQCDGESGHQVTLSSKVDIVKFLLEFDK